MTESHLQKPSATLISKDSTTSSTTTSSQETKKTVPSRLKVAEEHKNIFNTTEPNNINKVATQTPMSKRVHTRCLKCSLRPRSSITTMLSNRSLSSNKTKFHLNRLYEPTTSKLRTRGLFTSPNRCGSLTTNCSMI